MTSLVRHALVQRALLPLLATVLGLSFPSARASAAEIPSYLPRYDLDIHLDVDHHVAQVRQRVTWVNRHACPTKELEFNVHSHYAVPDDQVGFLAKMLEIMRMMPSEALSFDGPAFQLEKVTLLEVPQPDPLKKNPLELPTIRGQKGDEETLPLPRPLGVRPNAHVHLELPFEWKKDNDCALRVPLPEEIGPGDSVTVEIAFTMKLPQKQGRWGQWHGVTFLSNWLPVVAFYDEHGWQPTPFVPWHQPWFNEAGVYHARVTLPCDQKIGCTGSVIAARDLGDGWQQVDIVVCAVRDFALLTSARYEEFCGEACGVKLKVLAFLEHEHYARFILKIMSEAIPVYSQWFGPYPYPEFTIAESYFGWNGNECSGLVMIDARVFGMPHMAHNYVDYLVSHETCHQWWYNTVGTNGYCETFMDEAPATYFSHKLQDLKHGKNNPMIEFPSFCNWLPSIDRENYRYYGMYGTIGRGEACATVQEMPKFGHVINLFSMCYDRGSKVIGMIENRLGEAAFFDFMRLVYCKYYFKILRVADFQHELEAYTGQSWEEFFHHWLYSGDMTDWCVEKVHVEPAERHDCVLCRCVPSALRCRVGVCRVKVLLHQKAEYNEATVLGFCLNDEGAMIRVPIQPQIEHMDLEDPPGQIDVLPDNRVSVEVVLPCKPKQIMVDPDKLLVDPNPANNTWHKEVKWRVTPFYSFLDETDLTCDYDKWNIIAGPWVYFPAYEDPWFVRSVLIGGRLGAYRTQCFSGGLYAAYRTDYRDVVVGGDALWDHTPWPHTQVGLIAEHRLATILGGDQHANRGVAFGRYVFDYGDSLYLPPMQYMESYVEYQDNFLPFVDRPAPDGAERYQRMETTGIHYHLDYLTPYWDPEGGFRFDAAVACGGVRLQHDAGVGLQNERGFQECFTDFSYVKGLPDCLGCLSETRLAIHAYGAAATLKQGEFFPLGGETRFRGFDLNDRQGNVIWGGTLEWRVPLIRDVIWDTCDHVAGVRNVYLAAFYDVGDCYVNGHAYGEVAHAFGGGLRADVAWFSFIERTILRVDIAKTVNLNTPVQVWFGVQHPF